MVKTKVSLIVATLLALWKGRKSIIVVMLAVLAIYTFGLRKPLSVSSCHAASQQQARVIMKQRAANSPDNEQFRVAAAASMYANEDYAPAFSNCMLRKGYML